MIPEVIENIENNIVTIKERISNCDIDSELVELISDTYESINKDRYAMFGRIKSEKDEATMKEYRNKLGDIVFNIEYCSCHKKKS